MKLNLDTPDEQQAQIAQSARARRLALSITQAELAARAGLSLSAVKRFEQSGAIPLKSLLHIAEVLDCLQGFGGLFPDVDIRRLDDLAGPQTRQRVRKS